jgi:PAS domain-containing protein
VDGLVASVLAPRPFSRWLPAGVLAVLVVTGVDAAIAGVLALAASLAIVTVLVALAGRIGDTLAVAGVGAVAGVVSGTWNGFALSWAYAVFAILAGGVLALLVALLRANAVINDRRLALLRELLRLADRPDDVAQLGERILAMLVPAFADAAVLDSGGERVAARGAPGDAGDRIALPLTARGEAFGALEVALDSSGRRYSAGDRTFAELVSGRVAVVLDNAGLSRQAREAEQRLIAALDALGEAVTMNGPDGRTVYANHAAVALLKASSVEDLTTREVGEISARFLLLDEHGAPIAIEDLPAFRALRGDDRPPPLLLRNIVRATGEERWLVNKVTVLRRPDGSVDRVVNVIEDVSEVKRAERAQALLGDAMRVLSESADHEPALQRVAELVADRMADWCAIDLRTGRAARRVGLAPAGAPRPEPPGDELAVPLVAGGEPLGTLSLVRADEVRRFTPADRAVAEQLGERAAAAVLGGRLARERAEIARELQHGLLPPGLPEIPGLEVAALYRPAGELNEVGGDFYDAFPTPAGWMVVIGDVAGQGARAAALTGMARFTLRSVGQLTGDPVQAAEQLNRTLRDQPELSLCTAVCLLLREGPGGLEALTVSMGHPLPALLRDGAATGLGRPGTLAGAFDDSDWTASRTALVPGDAIVLYTDGVFDTVGRDGRLGEEQLLALLGASPPGAAAVVAHVDAVLHDFQAGPQADDTALVALAVRG